MFRGKTRTIWLAVQDQVGVATFPCTAQVLWCNRPHATIFGSRGPSLTMITVYHHDDGQGSGGGVLNILLQVPAWCCTATNETGSHNVQIQIINYFLFTFFLRTNTRSLCLTLVIKPDSVLQSLWCSWFTNMFAMQINTRGNDTKTSTNI